MKYKHLSNVDRVLIHEFLKTGKSQKFIADYLERNRSTISREIKRNIAGKYHWDSASTKTQKRRRLANKRSILKYEKFLSFLYDNYNEKTCSIEIIATIAKRGNLFENMPSGKTIYRWIHNDLLRIKNGELLRAHNKNKYKNTYLSKVPKKYRTSIRYRPRSINDRKIFGHWEGDSIVSKKSLTRVITLVERLTRYGVTIMTNDGKMASTYDEIVKTISSRNLPIKSLTFDNGSEFNLMYKLKKELNINVYYCNPYTPSERGTNEVWNGLLRRFYPKYTNWNSVSNNELQRVTKGINTMPRKILDYKSALELFNENR